MKLPFRHGIVSFQKDISGTPIHIQKNSDSAYLDVNVSPEPTIGSIAHGSSDYLFAEVKSTSKAWGPFSDNTLTYYLYWDINMMTGELTRGYTTLQPITASGSPTHPSLDQHWFDQQSTKMKVWGGTKWSEKLRIFAGVYANAATLSLYGLGSQAYISVECAPGYLARERDGRLIRLSSGEYLTTSTDMLFGHSPLSSAIRLYGDYFQAVASESIPKFRLVSLTGSNSISLASSNTLTPKKPIGLVANDLIPGDISNIVFGGAVTNLAWNWRAVDITKSVYCGMNGEITTTRPVDPFAYKIGIILDRTTILLDIDTETEMPDLALLGGLSSVSAVAPLESTTIAGGVVISMPPASTTDDGYMPASDKLALNNLGVALVTETQNRISADAGKANLVHDHEIADVNGLQGVLDGKASVSHTQSISTITNLQNQLDGKAPFVHVHGIAEVTGLTSMLDNKSNVDHQHSLDSLSDVSTTGANASDVLRYDNGVWIAAPIETSSGEAIIFDVVQTSHGLSQGNVIYAQASPALTFHKAIANDKDSLGLCIVYSVTDANNFKAILAGKMTGFSGLVTGQYYFTSDTAAGTLTATEPTLSNPMVFALSSTTGLVLNYRPSDMSAQVPTGVAGNHTEIQFNNNGEFGSIPEFTFNPETFDFILDGHRTSVVNPGQFLIKLPGTTEPGTMAGSISLYAGWADADDGIGGNVSIGAGTGGLEGGNLYLNAGNPGVSGGIGGRITLMTGSSDGVYDGGSIFMKSHKTFDLETYDVMNFMGNSMKIFTGPKAATPQHPMTSTNLRFTITEAGEWMLDSDVGANGQVLTSQGGNTAPIWADSAVGGLQNIVEDLTPQLGGELDVNTFSIITPDTVGGEGNKRVSIRAGSDFGPAGVAASVVIAAGSSFDNAGGPGGNVTISSGNSNGSSAGNLSLRVGTGSLTPGLFEIVTDNDDNLLSIYPSGSWAIGPNGQGSDKDILTSKGTFDHPTWTPIIDLLPTNILYTDSDVEISGPFHFFSTAPSSEVVPTLPDHLANKAYVDAVASGLTFKSAVFIITTANLSATYDNGTSGNGATLMNASGPGPLIIDAIIMSVDQRVLVKDQTDKKQNGIYVVTVPGDSGTAWIMTRAEDADNTPNNEVTGGMFVFVDEGSKSETGWVLSTPHGNVDLGVDELEFTQFSSSTTLPAGSNSEIQFNNSNNFGASSDLSWNDTNRELNVIGKVYSKYVTEAQTSPVITAEQVILNLDAGSIFTVTLTSNVSTLTIANPPSAGKTVSINIVLVQDGTGSRTVAWPSSFKWPNGVAFALSTTAAAKDIVTAITYDGGVTWLAMMAGKDFR